MTTAGRATYPRYFKTPCGKAVSISAMAGALRRARRGPDQDFWGWNWFPTPGRLIVQEFRNGLHARINARGLSAASRWQSALAGGE